MESKDILRIVAKHFNIKESDIISTYRGGDVPKARQAFCLVSSIFTLKSSEEIGGEIGLSSFSVQSSIRTAENNMFISDFRKKYNAIVRECIELVISKPTEMLQREYKDDLFWNEVRSRVGRTLRQMYNNYMNCNKKNI